MEDKYISKINNIIGKAHMVTFDVSFDDIKIFELENQIIILMGIKDNTGSMSALLIGRRDEEIKNVIDTTNLEDKYRVTGNIPFDKEYVYQGLRERIKDDTKIKREMLKDRVLFIKRLEKLWGKYGWREN